MTFPGNSRTERREGVFFTWNSQPAALHWGKRGAGRCLQQYIGPKEAHNSTAMLRKPYIILFAAMAFIMAGPGNSVAEDAQADKIEILHYEDIPGLTGTEKAAIESLKAQNRTLTYGALLSTEAFIDRQQFFRLYGKALCPAFLFVRHQVQPQAV